MTQLAMDLPENVFSALRMAPREFANEMRIAAAEFHWLFRESGISSLTNLISHCFVATLAPIPHPHQNRMTCVNVVINAHVYLGCMFTM